MAETGAGISPAGDNDALNIGIFTSNRGYANFSGIPRLNLKLDKTQ
jgi:hypothetical protein